MINKCIFVISLRTRKLFNYKNFSIQTKCQYFETVSKSSVWNNRMLLKITMRLISLIHAMFSDPFS